MRILICKTKHNLIFVYVLFQIISKEIRKEVHCYYLENSFQNTEMNFKRGLLKNVKNKNVLEIDVEKDGGIIYFFLNVGQ